VAAARRRLLTPSTGGVRGAPSRGGRSHPPARAPCRPRAGALRGGVGGLLWATLPNETAEKGRITQENGKSRFCRTWRLDSQWRVIDSHSAAVCCYDRPMVGLLYKAVPVLADGDQQYIDGNRQWLGQRDFPFHEVLRRVPKNGPSRAEKEVTAGPLTGRGCLVLVAAGVCLPGAATSSPLHIGHTRLWFRCWRAGRPPF